MQAQERKDVECHGRLYVAIDVKHLASTKEGEQTWWCVAKTSAPGDVGIIYQTMVGIKYVFTVKEMEEPNAFCKSFGMATAQIKMVSVLATPVSSSQLRAHREFRKLTPVRRNFQQRWFDLDDDCIEPLLEFLQCGR